MSDHEWEGIGLYQAIINIIAASTSAALGVLKLTGGTMSGVLNMGSQLITGLPQATAAGHALRYEAQGPGTLPTTALFPNTVTATNVTAVAFTDTDTGAQLSLTSATATPRLSGRTGAGSRIAARVSQVQTSTATIVAGGAGVFISRADGKFVAFTRNLGAYSVFYFTDKDTYSTARATIVGTVAEGGPVWMRLGDDGAGNIVASTSPDGVTWQIVYTGTIVAAFGDAGAVTLCGPCFFTQNATLTAAVSISRCTISAVL